MRLIEFDNYELRVADEAMLVGPIRRMFNSDVSARHEDFFMKMSYLFFMCDPVSNYAYISDEKERAAEVIRQEGLPKGFEPDGELLEAMEAYRKLVVTPSVRLLETTQGAVNRMCDFLNGFDPAAVDEKGRLLTKFSEFVSAVKQIPQLSKDLLAAERAVRQEQLEERKMRKGSRKSIMDLSD